MSDAAARRAAERLRDRVVAIAGNQPGDTGAKRVEASPSAANRMILAGLIEHDAVDAVVKRMPEAALIAMRMLAACLPDDDTDDPWPADPVATLQCILGQHVAYGLMLREELAKEAT